MPHVQSILQPRDIAQALYIDRHRFSGRKEIVASVDLENDASEYQRIQVVKLREFVLESPRSFDLAFH